MTPPIRLDRQALSESAAALAKTSGRPVRISGLLMNLWCGASQPTEELREWLQDRGCEIVPAVDGWDVRVLEKEFQLR